MKQITFLIALIGLTFSCSAQTLVIPKEERFMIDSVAKQNLFESLSRFLDQKEGANKENTCVLKSDLPAMSALLDEMKGMDKNVKLKDDHFYKPTVQNVTTAAGGQLLVQLAYIGCIDGVPVQRACFRLLAVPDSGKFRFCTVLARNTAGWKSKKIAFANFRYRDTLNLREAKAYVEFVEGCNKRLNVKAGPITYYDCRDYPDALQLLGIDYKLDYSGIRYDGLVAHEEGRTVTVIGGYTDNSRFDRHDLWHDRLRMALSPDKINRPVDEGCAYLYGGSWGKTWAEVLASFKQYAANHPDADWLKLYSGNIRFNDDEQRPCYIAYFINAIIVQKIEKEKGFAPVMELLGCGKRQADEGNYFDALKKASGINKADFNKTVWELIKNEPN